MTSAINRFVKNCPDCGAEQTYGRSDHYKQAVEGNWRCKSCSNRDNTFRGKYELIPITWFNTKMRGGVSRGFTWDLTIQDIWEMFLAQEGQCALSGLPISWSETGLTATVSIDRIDNSEGYIKGNVQLLHKDINMMKHAFEQDYFTQLCRKVAENA